MSISQRLASWLVVLFLCAFWLVGGALLTGCAAPPPARCEVVQPGSIEKQPDGSLRVVARAPELRCADMAPTKDPLAIGWTLLPQSEEPSMVSSRRDPLRPGL